MIKIATEEFEMEQVQTSPFFDLSFLTVINKGKANERKEMKLVAYGLPFEECIKRIVSNRMSVETNMTLSEYIDKFKKEVSKVLKEIKNEK